MEFRILGPLEIVEGAAALKVSVKPRAVLAMLLMHVGEPVSVDRLAQALWGAEAPADVAKTIQVHVSRLRKALGDRDAIETSSAGYTLAVAPDALDARRFEDLVEAGQAALADGH